MANMSYCRFENTYKDMIDCHSALMYKDVDSFSESEINYAHQMMILCEMMLRFRDEVEAAKDNINIEEEE